MTAIIDGIEFDDIYSAIDYLKIQIDYYEKQIEFYKNLTIGGLSDKWEERLNDAITIEFNYEWHLSNLENMVGDYK